MAAKVKIAQCVSGLLWMLESNLKKDYTRQAQSSSPPAKGEYPKGEGVFPTVRSRTSTSLG